MSAGHTATRLPPSKPQKVSKSKMTKSEVVGVTLDATALLLATLRDVARLAPIPMVQSAATLALAILNTVQGVRDNKGAFRRLADDVGNLVCAVALKAQKATGSVVPSDLHSNLESLITTLSGIQEFASKQLQRNIVIRLIQQMSDLRVIQQYRETLRQSLDVFGLQASISIQENMATLLAQQEEILKELKEHKPDSGNLIGSPNPSMVVPQIDSSHGTFEFTSIERDQTRVDSSQHITNTNSNNTTTTKTENSGNDRSVRLFSDGRDDEIVSMATEIAYLPSIRRGLGGQLDYGREYSVKDNMVKGEPEVGPDEGVQPSYMAWATERGSAKLQNEKVYQARGQREGGQGTAELGEVDGYARVANVKMGGLASLQSESREQGRREQKTANVEGFGAQHIAPDHAMAWAMRIDDSSRMANDEGVEFSPSLQYLEREQRRGGQGIVAKNGLEASHVSQDHGREGSEEGHRVATGNGLGTQHISPGHTQNFSQGSFMHERSGAATPEAPEMRSSSTLGVPFQRSNNPFLQSPGVLHPDSALHGTNDGSLGNPALHPNSRAIPMPNPMHRYFPNIKSPSGKFSFTHVGGDQNFLDSSYHVTNNNSGNNTTTITTDSHNDSSARMERSAHSLSARQKI